MGTERRREAAVGLYLTLLRCGAGRGEGREQGSVVWARR